MNLERIMVLFTLFSKQDALHFLPLIQLSMAEVRERLRAGADKTDERLAFLCAAAANLHFAETQDTQDKTFLTAAGGAAQAPSQRYGAAKTTFDEYCAICADLLMDRDFLFFGVRG